MCGMRPFSPSVFLHCRYWIVLFLRPINRLVFPLLRFSNLSSLLPRSPSWNWFQAVSLRHAHNHREKCEEHVWAFTPRPKTGRCRFSPLPRRFFRKKDNVRMWSQNRKIHQRGKAGLNCLHETIHPCLAENENRLCHFLSLPSRFFLQCKWG